MLFRSKTVGQLSGLEKEEIMEIMKNYGTLKDKNEELQKLFQPFEKLSSKATGGETGTGLGLAIAKKMIELHQGVLKVESSPGRGAKFSFELPINPSTCDP